MQGCNLVFNLDFYIDLHCLSVFSLRKCILNRKVKHEFIEQLEVIHQRRVERLTSHDPMEQKQRHHRVYLHLRKCHA